MRHRNTKKILGRNHSHRKSLVKNLAGSLILYESVKTTPAKAKVLQSYVERIVTLGKKNNLAAKRELTRRLPTVNSVKKVLEVISPHFKERNGGFTSIHQLGLRQGDGAQIVQINFSEQFKLNEKLQPQKKVGQQEAVDAKTKSKI
jgi:large subunit ribosomal protein L17